MKNKTYIQHWKSKGEYGEIRIQRMLARKESRHLKRCSKTRGGFKRINGKLYQVCSYQPSWQTSWCEYPCNGDC